MDISVIILAAGQGTRMRSKKPKVLHPVGGNTILGHIVDTAMALDTRQTTIVYGHGGDLVKDAFKNNLNLTWAEQKEQLGTGHAAQQAIPTLKETDVCLLLVGDAPLIQQETLQALAEASAGESLALLTVTLDDPSGYGRIVKNTDGQVEAIVEHKDATPEQLEICEINTGIMAIPGNKLASWLECLDNNNAQQEYYLTDLIAIARKQGFDVVTRQASSELEVAGINNKVQLAAIEREYQRLQAEKLMLQGVLLRDPARLDIRGDVEVGMDVEIDSNVQLLGKVVLQDDVVIGPNCVIKNSIIRSGTVIKANSVIEDSLVGEACDIGPFARLRPDTTLSRGAKVGNFVEIKKANIGEGSKVNHLAYVGDADIGSGVNIGAGVITCNYDGANKHKTVIGDGAFIGSDVNLVAPVTIGAGATIGAGSTITRDAPEQQLTLTRVKQRSVEGWQRPVKNK